MRKRFTDTNNLQIPADLENWDDGAGGHLASVKEAIDALDEADHELDHAVCGARLYGCTWAQIGAELGVSKQAAQQRFGWVDTVDGPDT